MRPPWSIGLKMARNRHRGRMPTGAARRPAFEGQSPIGGSRPGLRSASRGRAQEWHSSIVNGESLSPPRARGAQTTMSPISGRFPSDTISSAMPN
jgi:hypothetical protein